MRISRIAGAAAAVFLAAFFTLGLRIASLADMTVTQEVTTIVGEKKTTSSQSIYWTKSKMRMDVPGGRLIITDLDNKTMTVLEPEAKSYTQQNLEDLGKQLAALPDEFKKVEFSVGETGEKKTIDGKPCEKLVFTIGPTETTVWVTDKIAIDPAFSEFNKKFLELTKDIKVLSLQGEMRAVFERRNAYPYLTIIEVRLPFAAETQRTEAKVKDVSYKKIDPSVFAIPSGYSKQAFPTAPLQQ